MYSCAWSRFVGWIRRAPFDVPSISLIMPGIEVLVGLG
jgi:hypothetical protein